MGRVHTLFVDSLLYSPSGSYSDLRVLAIAAVHRVYDPSSHHSSVDYQYFRAYRGVGCDQDAVFSKEREVVESFYGYLRKVLAEADVDGSILFIVGWDHLRILFPLLHQKLLRAGYGESSLFNDLYVKPNHVDLRQLYIRDKGFRLKGTSFSAAVSEILGSRFVNGEAVAEAFLRCSYRDLDLHLSGSIKHLISLFRHYRKEV